MVSNHQSFLDPPLVGIGVSRRVKIIARKTLYVNFLAKMLFYFLDAIPIDREKGDLSTLKSVVKVLKKGNVVLMFPEGTRSEDGKLLPFKPGFLLIAKHANVPILPAAISGTKEIWPKHKKFTFKTGKTRVIYGEPISIDSLPLDKNEACEFIRNKIIELQNRIAF